jgi:hypothetical protein
MRASRAGNKGAGGFGGFGESVRSPWSVVRGQTAFVGFVGFGESVRRPQSGVHGRNLFIGFRGAACGLWHVACGKGVVRAGSLHELQAADYVPPSCTGTLIRGFLDAHWLSALPARARTVILIKQVDAVWGLRTLLRATSTARTLAISRRCSVRSGSSAGNRGA